MFEVAFTSSPRAPGAARDAVARWLSGRVEARFLDDVALVVTELVGNSVRHAGATTDDVIRVRAQP